MGADTVDIGLSVERQTSPGLAVLASQAALELDDLYLGRSRGLSAVSMLAQDILAAIDRSRVAPPSIPVLNPSTAVVMKRAIDDSNVLGCQKIDTIQDLVGKIDKIVFSLKTLALEGAPRALDMGEVESLRSFCVHLSKNEFANNQLLEELRPIHPYRR